MTKLLANCVHHAVAIDDEVQAPVDRPLHFDQFLLLSLPLAVPFTPEPDSLLEEGRGKSFKKFVTAKQDILEPFDKSRPEALGLDAGGIIITGTFFMAVGAALLLSIIEGDGSATTPAVYKPS